MANIRYGNGSLRRKQSKRLRSEGRPCHLCGHPIIYDAHYLDRRAFEVDEKIPVSKGGSPYEYDNLAAAHRCCNEWRGNRALTPALCVEIRARYERTFMRVRAAVKHSRKW